jgi:hypothetical protein
VAVFCAWVFRAVRLDWLRLPAGCSTAAFLVCAF